MLLKPKRVTRKLFKSPGVPFCENKTESTMHGQPLATYTLLSGHSDKLKTVAKSLAVAILIWTLLAVHVVLNWATETILTTPLLESFLQVNHELPPCLSPSWGGQCSSYIHPLSIHWFLGVLPIYLTDHVIFPSVTNAWRLQQGYFKQHSSSRLWKEQLKTFMYTVKMGCTITPLCWVF